MRGDRVRLVKQAKRNAEEALDRRMAETTTQGKILRELADTFELGDVPKRIEVYDNSHIMGTNATGAMIVAGPEGFRKNSYRKFNIKSAQTDDDFGMMKEVLERRFSRLEKEDPDRASGEWPDLVLIDGGKGHGRIGEDLAPCSERLIGCDQAGAALVASTDELEQDGCFGLVFADIGEIVEDSDAGLAVKAIERKSGLARTHRLPRELFEHHDYRKFAEVHATPATVASPSPRSATLRSGRASTSRRSGAARR